MARLIHGWFRFDGWACPDPNDAKRLDAMHTARYNLSALTQHEAYLLCEMAEAYRHFAAHPAPTKSIISQLRELRREVKEND